MSMSDLLDRVWLGNSVRTWLVAAATAAVVYLALALIRRLVIRKLGARAAQTDTDLDDLAVELFRRTRHWFLAVVALHSGLRVAQLPARADSVVDTVTMLLVLLQGGVWVNGLIGHFVARQVTRRQAAGDTSSVTTIRALGLLARLVAWAMLVLLLLDNLGFNVTTLVTGLGIGGIALALAVQNVLGDILAAMAIVFDKPFVVGDTIIVDTVVGTVEHVGIKTTRLRSLNGEQIILSNNDLLKSRIRNMKRMFERRVLLTVDVNYDTPDEQLARIPGMLRELIEAQEAVRFDRSHFASLAESALRFEAVYYKLTPDYALHMDTQQAILLGLVARFRAEGIEFAFPTRTVVVSGGEGKPVAGFTS
jgi:small-conductance mechanosensitive channel